MPAIHPPATVCRDNPRTPNPDDEANANSSKLASTRTLVFVRTQGWKKLLPQPDIAECIAISKLRCVITLISLALLATDIPRTGLGVVNLQDYYPVPLMPSTAVRFGPFNYPVVRVWRLDNGTDDTGESEVRLAGLKGKQPISTARVWSYQYDTTSVGLRGAVQLLKVAEFPPFLLYRNQPDQPPRNANSLLELNTTFTILDAVITAAHKKLQQDDNSSRTLSYATLHNWIDRLHHYAVRSVSKNSAWRLHSLHVGRISKATDRLAICAVTAKRTSRPRFCNHPGIWKCKNPLNESLPAVRLWDHIDLRLQYLQQIHTGLELDVALLSSQRLSSTSGAMRSTFYNYEALEIVVLTRGKRCVKNVTNSSSSTTCTTVFVDDYRYERDIVQTTLVDWFGIIAMLRGGAQTYAWIRLLLLVYGAYTASGQSASEKIPSTSRFVSAALILLKIPFQVIVYSSLFPVSAYVGALVLDSSFFDIFLDSYWAAVGGAVNIKLIPFIQTTSVQMRSVWALALFAVAVLFAMRRLWSRDEGLLGIRGLLISFTSSLTVFGPYKSVYYRDMDIVSIFQMPDRGQTMDTVQSSNPAGCYNISSYIFGGSSRTVRLCIVAVVFLALTIKALGYLTPRGTWTRKATRGLIFRLSKVAPCGLERLWKTTTPIIHFSVPIPADAPTNTTTSNPAALISPAKPHTSSPNTSRVAPLSLLNLSIAGLSQRIATEPTMFRQSRRRPWHFCSKKQSAATPKRFKPPLMNIAMMTDPWNFFWLRVIGIPLYLYQVRPTPSTDNNNSVPPYAVILPYEEEEMEERTGLSGEKFSLLDSASSRDVPMSVLLQCG